MKRLLYILCCIVAAVSCQQDAPQPQERPFTQQELIKKHLDESFSVFFESLELEEDVEDWGAFIRQYSSVSLDMSGALVYRFRKGNVTQITIRFKKTLTSWSMDAQLYGGVSMKGYLTLSKLELPTEFPTDWDWQMLESLWDIDVYDQNVRVATLGMESYAYTEAGKAVNRPIFVFRFPDGTSYALTSFLLVESLMDYLLKNVLSTE